MSPALVEPPELRRYSGDEIGPDGYPFVWHDGDPAIKDFVRGLAEYRCLRCGHPYPPRYDTVADRGEWSTCDEGCAHAPPGRWRLEGHDDWIPWLAGTRDTLPTRALVQAHWRILTVHHLDEDKANCCWWNLAALCQRCHLRMQRAVVMGRPYHYTHSEWFRPFAAGFYAWKYEGANLRREVVEARLDELLAYELRFTQEELEV